MTEYVITEEQKKKIEEINHAFGVMKKYNFTYVADDSNYGFVCNKDYIVSIIVNRLNKYYEDYLGFKSRDVKIIQVDGTQNIDYTISIARLYRDESLYKEFSGCCTSPYFDISENKND